MDAPVDRFRAALSAFDQGGAFSEVDYHAMRAALAGALGRRPSAQGDLLDGLANLFFERHVMHDRRRAELLAMNDDALRRAVRTRFRQLVADEHDDHAPYHALRAHVREALEHAQSAAAEWPQTIRERQAFSRPLVESAVHALWAESGRKPSAAEATAALFGRYLRPLVRADEFHESHHLPEAVTRRLDGQRLATGILAVLTTDEKDLLRWVLAGDGSVEKWAQKAGCSRATAYRSMSRLKSLCRLEFSERSSGTQLEALSALKDELEPE